MAIEYRGKKFDRYNAPKKSDKPGHKMMVLAKKGDKVRLLYFGDGTGLGHNYNAVARKAFKSRFRKGIAKNDKLSKIYWSNKVLWSSAKGASKKAPSKTQKQVFGKSKKK